MPLVTRTVEIAAPPARVMDVITDFARYPEFLPEMVRVVVLRVDEGAWTVAFTVRLVRIVEYTLQLERVDALNLRWRLVEGAFKSNDGGWSLEPLDGGTRTRATYTIDLDIGMFVPGSVLRTMTESDLPHTLDAFRRRAEG